MKKVVGIIRVNTYDVIVRAVEGGVTYGMNRAHKHTDNPTRETTTEAITNAVISELCEVLMFDHGEES